MKTSAEQICDGRCFLPMRMCGRICAEKMPSPTVKKSEGVRSVDMVSLKKENHPCISGGN